MNYHQEFTLTLPVGPADHMIGPTHEHLQSGRASGARSTPTFFVNGAIQDVSFGLRRLSDAVEAALGR